MAAAGANRPKPAEHHDLARLSGHSSRPSTPIAAVGAVPVAYGLREHAGTMGAMCAQLVRAYADTGRSRRRGVTVELNDTAVYRSWFW